jgi:predicted alternative tryptophan synthase beta-subunit
MSHYHKITLSEDEIPEHWYNIVADMPNTPWPRSSRWN